jgi:hypothetical protein
MYGAEVVVPTIWRQGRILYMIYTNDHGEPHIHLVHGDREAKIEITTLVVVWNKGFKKSEIKAATDTIREKTAKFLEEWRRYHD